MRPPPGPPPPPAPVPATISVTPSTATLTALGRTVQLNAEARDQDGQVLSGVTVAWSSSSPAVATVAANGLVTAVRGGIATITAAAGNATGSARVTVEQSAANVTVEPPSHSFEALGDTIRAAATASDEDGHSIPMPAVTWTSDYPEFAAVDSTGLITAVGNGSATITASVGTARGTAEVTVEQVPHSMRVTSPGSALAVGDSMQFTATVFDRNGHPIDGLTLTWSSSDTTVAAVDQEGRVLGVSEGSVEITAASGALSASKTLAVQGEADLMRGALIALYESTDGPNWKQNEDWLSDAPLADWHGVSTDAEGRVTQLALVDNGLRGTIPPQIENLKTLRRLWLYSNELSGPIPPQLGNLPELRSTTRCGPRGIFSRSALSSWRFTTRYGRTWIRSMTTASRCCRRSTRCGCWRAHRPTTWGCSVTGAAGRTSPAKRAFRNSNRSRWGTRWDTTCPSATRRAP
ncbi:Ig-like domain-containing protein [Candidatus Palauibacter sp.]|uniref:Ig-like domain-containing protein n=1 Tax=Candidatus Palauibacter sp. TaxID=3101350 RepID=UPI003AF20F6A